MNRNMERKIGEIFEHNGEWYQCLISPDGSYTHCDMNFGGKCPIPIKECKGSGRSALSYVIFKKLEKVEEPITVKGRTFQKLRNATPCKNCVFNIPNKVCYKKDYIDGPCLDDEMWAEIKQTKEDMEEKKDNYDGNMDKECIPICDALNSIPDVHTVESCCGHCKDRFMVFFTCDNPHSLAIIARVFDRRYISTSQPWYIELQTKDSGAYDYFIHSKTKYDSEIAMMKDVNQIIENIKYWCDDKFASHFRGCDNTKHSNSEKIGKNLKPFDLEAAKQGKPVCTRDGRKARIICFDRKLFYRKVSYPILALVERSDGEDDVCGYNEKGKVLIEDGAEYKDDLMMLPKKKEGWVNLWRHESGTVHPDGNIYSSKEEAVKIGSKDYNYVDTVKIEWEE